LKLEEKLFSGFGPVSSKQWKQKIQYELQGADYNETLVWESPEGIKVKPFYHPDDEQPALAVPDPANTFSICQDIFVFDIDKSIYRANDSLKRGAESLRFIIRDEKTEVAKLLNGLPSQKLTLFFDLQFLSLDFIKKLDAALVDKEYVVFCHIDPIGHLAKDGNWFPGKDNFDTLATIDQTAGNISAISVGAGQYQNAGANIVQQIAYTLAHANEYLERVPAIKNPFLLEISVGTNYFFEIAKLRALRLLFGLIAKEYKHEAGCYLLITPTKRNKTLYDYNVNMLRTTTECMSAILGGADAISNLPYDALYHKSNEFGERISRNQLLILKYESYFDVVGNAAQGSYYIESLTQQLAEKALALFKEIEAGGGFLSQLRTGTIQRKIKESADKEQALFDEGKEILLGTNRHPNKNDRMAHDLELFPFMKIKQRKTIVTPIIEKRLAEKIEQQRLETEKEVR
jgi:methylmalonyl-CoA mutase